MLAICAVVVVVVEWVTVKTNNTPKGLCNGERGGRRGDLILPDPMLIEMSLEKRKNFFFEK